MSAQPEGGSGLCMPFTELSEKLILLSFTFKSDSIFHSRWFSELKERGRWECPLNKESKLSKAVNTGVPISSPRVVHLLLPGAAQAAPLAVPRALAEYSGSRQKFGFSESH